MADPPCRTSLMGPARYEPSADRVFRRQGMRLRRVSGSILRILASPAFPRQVSMLSALPNRVFGGELVIVSAMRSLPLGHIPERGGRQILGRRPDCEVRRVDATAVQASRPAATFRTRCGLVVTQVINLPSGIPQHEPMGVNGLSLNAQPTVAVRLDVSGVPRDARTIDHASNVVLIGRLDGRPVLPDFTDGTGSI